MSNVERKCTKVCFANESAADFYIKKLKKTSKRSVKPITSYLCPSCLSWHLSSSINYDDMKMIYKDREIANLKTKVLNLRNENETLKKKLGIA